MEMPFDPAAFGPEVEQILNLDSAGLRLMPLLAAGCSSPEARRILAGRTAGEIFREAVHPKGAAAGIWVYFSAFQEAHEIAQEDHSVEGSYWHAIVHRQEPDAWNSGYWFRRVGRHPIYPALNEHAAALAESSRGAGFRPSRNWDATAFVDFCEDARTRPGSEAENLALAIQRAEWQLLFEFCARKKP